MLFLFISVFGRIPPTHMNLTSQFISLYPYFIFIMSLCLPSLDMLLNTFLFSFSEKNRSMMDLLGRLTYLN